MLLFVYFSSLISLFLFFLHNFVWPSPLTFALTEESGSGSDEEKTSEKQDEEGPEKGSCVWMFFTKKNVQLCIIQLRYADMLYIVFLLEQSSSLSLGRNVACVGSKQGYLTTCWYVWVLLDKWQIL